MHTLFSNHKLSLSLLSILSAACLGMSACSSDGDGDGGGDGDGDGDCLGSYDNLSCSDIEGTCIEVCNEAQLQEAANSVEPNTTIVISSGDFDMDNQVTLRGAGLTIRGQGIDETNLSFASQAAQSNGIDAVGDDFEVGDLTIIDAKKDGLRVEDSNGVTIRRLKVTWSNPEDETNGSYGIYPVKVQNVLIEDSEAYRSSDAGIYVGQCQNAIVRNNIAAENVAGIEIENTQYADVYGNEAVNNTGGLLIFDLPGNPVIGHDIKIHDNKINNNNTTNFAPGGTVGIIPPGTGTVAFGSRRLEIWNNEYLNNNTGDIAILSGLIVESDPALWNLSPDELVGDADLDNLRIPVVDGFARNYTTNDVYVHDNMHMGGGQDLGGIDPVKQEIGLLLQLLYQWGSPDFAGVDSILYDAIGESSFDAMDPSGNSNDNFMCFGGNGDVSFVSLNVTDDVLSGQFVPSLDDVYRPDAPFAPFDCSEIASGPIGEITLD